MKRRRDNLVPARAPSRSAPRGTDANSHLSSGPEPDHGRSDEPSSSSSIPVQRGYEYDVFLSFREPDTRRGFTDFLYHSLKDVGVHTFFGDGEVRPGEELGPEILGAIEQSRVSVPIFSKQYASSTFCLKELAKMVECMSSKKQTIIPIFYDVSPSQVRHLTGAYAEAFSRHEKSRTFSIETIREWRDALNKVANISGWDLTHDRYQGEAIMNIVARILKLLRRPYLDVTNHLVGIEDCMEKVIRLLDIGADDVKVVGICGRSGIGKTTLAKAIYNQISDHFEGFSFLGGITERARQQLGLQALQARLLADISDFRHETPATVDEGLATLRDRLSNKEVLIILDDIGGGSQFCALVEPDWLGPGSRIIVTGQDSIVLNEFVRAECLYEVTELRLHDAFLLFCGHAFRRDSSPNEFTEISWDIVKMTEGFPLAIEVIGSFLHGKSMAVWVATLEKLRKVPQREIYDKLKITYDQLESECRGMFLDVACFLVGMDVRLAVYMWDDCDLRAEYGILKLQKMSLVKVGKDNKLQMPNQLRDLGWEIVRQESMLEPGRISRLWGGAALDVIRRNEGSESVEAICLDCGIGSSEHVISGSKFGCMLGLRFLELADANLCGNSLRPWLRWLDWLGITRVKMMELRWLGWHGTMGLNTLSQIYSKKLIILDLSASIVDETWDGWRLHLEAVNLKVLNLTDCHQLASTPHFSSFPHIEMLILQGCSLLSAVDPSIAHLVNLKLLDLRNCRHLEKLPGEIGYLVEMESLLIDGCPIREIPILEGLKKLRTLSAKSCRSLAHIPQSIEYLLELKELWLDDCLSLTELPTSIGKLKSLDMLSLSQTGVMSLPDSVGELSHLRVLNIDQCPIMSLPHSLGMLESLELLNASGCLNLRGEIPFELRGLELLRILRLNHTGITSIPTSIVGLSHLQTLDLEGCVNLQTLPKLPPSLLELKVTCTAFEAIPNRTDLSNLRRLEILNCSNCPVQVQGRSDEPSSSSSILIQPGYEYEVFLSFRGPDTRGTFTDSLYHSLVGAGIRTFKDDESLRLGEVISSELLQAIEQSRISIPIFSGGYASSKWCVKEVAKMVECNSTTQQEIIPIFYDVAPDQVQHQTGTYAEAFSTHEDSRKFTTEMIKEWRCALEKVGALKGWDLTCNRYEGKAISEVVSEVLLQLKKPYLDVTKHLVGIEDHVEEIMRLLDVGADDVKAVGICGMGGIGKTTIAKFIFNQLKGQFEYLTFLKDIREASQQSKGLESLQRQLVTDVLRCKQQKFSNTDAGKADLAHRLRDKKVLILLDDVNHVDQLNNLVGDLDWFGRGSRIIITAREVDVLCMSDAYINAPKINTSIYKVKEMHRHNALLLFCKHAFRQDLPLPNFASISLKIVEATGGLPLAIVAIGSYLSGKENGVWEEALTSLKSRGDILGKLKISYEALSYEQQEVFLDIVCLFSGMDSRIPVHVWKARGFSPKTTIGDLELRSLIRIGDSSEFLVHDLYRELGREIIREKSNGQLGKRSRLWCFEDAILVLLEEKGTKKVEAINMDDGIHSETCCFSSHNFEKLPIVWFLGLGNANLDGNFQGCLTDLRWLSHHGSNFLNIPNGLNLKKLVVLDLSRSNVSENWLGWNSLKEAEKLEVLDLSSCHQLTSTPDFPSLPQMKRLVLVDCRELARIGRSILVLKALEFLDLRYCSSLVHVPEELGSLGALKELHLDGSPLKDVPLSRTMRNLEIISAKSCRSLTEILWSIELPKLMKLFLDNCESLTVIPPSIGQLKSLTDLSLSHTSTIIIPETIGDLSALEVLNLDHCPIRTLPQSLWKLERIEVISASGCLGLTGEIPSEIGNMTSLRILCLDHTNVSSISWTVTRLPSLHPLNLKECKKIRTLPNLPSSLVNLKVTCMSFDTIPNLLDLVHLRDLEVLLLDKNAIILNDIEKFSHIRKLSITVT